MNLTGVEREWRTLGWSECEDKVNETEDGEGQGLAPAVL